MPASDDGRAYAVSRFTGRCPAGDIASGRGRRYLPELLAGLSFQLRGCVGAIDLPVLQDELCLTACRMPGSADSAKKRRNDQLAILFAEGIRGAIYGLKS